MNPIDRAGVRFAVCFRNDDHPASLEVGKVYPVLPDSDAARQGMLRVVDESGEDYLYPKDDFFVVVLREDVEQMLLNASWASLKWANA